MLPFLAVGLFTGAVLGFFKSHQNVVRYTVKIGAVLLIAMGLLTLTGAAGSISADLAAISGTVQEAPAAPQEDASSGGDQDAGGETGGQAQEDAESPVVPAPDFTLTDQFGNKPHPVRLRGADGVFELLGHLVRPLQVGGCRTSRPSTRNGGKTPATWWCWAWPDLISARRASAEDIAAFLEENGYTYPVVMDDTGALFYQYGISAYPTTFMIDTAGKRLRLRPGGRLPGRSWMTSWTRP